MDGHTTRLQQDASRVFPQVEDEKVLTNSSEKAMRCRKGLLRPGSRIDPLKHCAFRSTHTRVEGSPGPSTMNRSAMDTAALTAAIWVSPPTTEIRCALACRGGLGDISPMKRSTRSL